MYQTAVSWRDASEIGLWSVKIPGLAAVTSDSRWAQIDARVWDEADVLVPEDCVGDHGADAHQANLRDVHRRYAEVTMADDVIFYPGRIAASSDDPRSA